MRAAQPEPVRRPPGIGEPHRLGLQFTDGGQHHPGPLQHQFAERRGPGSGVVTIEEGAAEGLLDPPQLSAESGLGKPQCGGGLGEAPCVGYRTDRSQMAQLQLHKGKLWPQEPPGNMCAPPTVRSVYTGRTPRAGPAGGGVPVQRCQTPFRAASLAKPEKSFGSRPSTRFTSSVGAAL
ncbi:hypothetical protein GCM10027028_18170 [Streptomyces sundarbansensis]